MENIENEIWKSLSFMGYDGYEVSSLGRVKSLERTIIRNNNKKLPLSEKILKPTKNKDGYLYINLCKDGKRKMFTVHRLVCLTFLENPLNLPCINHKDENKENNHISNLEFCTYQYNNSYGTKPERLSKAHKGKQLSEEHKRKLSTTKKGKNHPMFGKISPKRIPILQFTKDMVFVKEFDSAKSASIELNIIRENIIACCKNKRKSAGGYIWKYKE